MLGQRSKKRPRPDAPCSVWPLTAMYEGSKKTQNMAATSEKIIEVVKCYPILYNLCHPEYKNLRKKNEIWDEIGKMLNMEGEETKKKWKNLRDAYSKHIRSEKTRTGQKAKSIDRYKTWPWAQQMSFFQSFLQFANTESNVDSLETTSQLEDEMRDSVHSPAQSLLQSAIPTAAATSVEQPSTDIATPQRTQGVKKRRCDDKPAISSVDKVLTYLQKKESNLKTPHDDVDLLFMGYAATVKKFSPRQQTMVKYQIAKIIMEAELEQQVDRNSTLLSPVLSSELSQNSDWSSATNTSNPTARWYEDFSENIL